MKTQLSRRNLLAVGLGAVVLGACRQSYSDAPYRRPPAPGPWRPNPPLAQPSSQLIACNATEANIEGPYYREGAPFRSSLIDPGTLGAPLCLTGRVLSLDCRSALAGAVLDVWQADAAGHYDNDGSSETTGAFRLRGRVSCDDKGAFELWTIVPGRYLNGASYRPAHIHVKLAAPGHQPLTTQLYFPGDPYNERDPFIRKSLIMDVQAGTQGAAAHYDFVLIPG
jgi:catechol 1,2-dioxygenase